MSKLVRLMLAVMLALGGWCAVVESTAKAVAEEASTSPKERRFQFDYSAKITGLTAGDQVRLWLPLAQETPHQEVKITNQNVPGKVKVATESRYGNRMLYSEWAAADGDDEPVHVRYQVVRREVKGLQKNRTTESISDEQRKIFTAGSNKIPLSGKPTELLRSLPTFEDDVQLASQLYERVDNHMRYDKSKPGYGTGDAVWACDSRFGNCTDFHSLFISLARIKGLPARFEIGFPLPTERGEGNVGGYHCWAYVYTEAKGWMPVDISEADKHPEMKEYYFGNLTENRMVFTVGRDITLVPKQAGPPLNYFVYPYVEVNGKSWPQEKIKPSFSFLDL